VPTITDLKKLKDTLDFNDVRRAKIDRQIEAKRKKRDRPSPTKLTKEWAKDRGYEFDVVEQRLPQTFITRDFCNFADAIMFHPSIGIVAVQITGSTDGGNHAARKAKIEAEPRAVAWLRAGGRVEVMSWSLRGAAGDPKAWKLRRDRALLGDSMSQRIGGWQEIEG
jgi:hypothetical protein